jgi:hypothetical protein
VDNCASAFTRIRASSRRQKIRIAVIRDARRRPRVRFARAIAKLIAALSRIDRGGASHRTGVDGAAARPAAG